MKLLIVVDMQNDFVTGSLGTSMAADIEKNVVNKMKSYIANGETVVLTYDTHNDDYLKTMEGKNLPVPHCIKNTKGWELTTSINSIKEENKLTTFEKPTFGSKELVVYIENLKNLEEIELIGLCTDICVVSNALLIKAFFPEMKISVDSKCCAGVTKETHDAALTTMKMCHIQVL